jgi:hypothetical protein
MVIAHHVLDDYEEQRCDHSSPVVDTGGAYFVLQALKGLSVVIQCSFSVSIDH